MEAPPPPSVAPPIPTTTTPTAAHLPESIDSSPRSRHTDSWDADPPPNQLSQKLRLMCSYGGHIVPRPHDKNLCYIGGDTRIIVIDRHTSLSDLHHRLSKTLLHNQSFSLKYQIPNEDLDSLISVTTDEDLENMVDEYDRLCNSSSAGGAAKPGRLRLFLFPKTSSNIEQILVETASTKSDDWFFNALNCKASPLSAGASDRGFSESSSVNCLLGLDDDSVGKATAAAAAAAGGRDAEAQLDGSKIGGNGSGNNNAVNHDIHSLPDSPMLDTTSSFGSTSSSPSVANLPPIRVHVDETPKAAVVLVSGIEDQFQQMSVMGVAGNVNLVQMQKQEEIGGSVAAGAVVSGVPVVVSGDYSNRVFSDDERSDHSGGYRKVQQIQPQVQQVQLQPQQIPQFLHQRQQTVAFDLASPDSVSSEGSVTNPLSRQRQPIYQDSIMQIQPSNTTRVAIPTNQIDPKTGDQNNSKVQMQQQPQAQESGYVLSTQFDQNHPQFQQHPQQYIHAGNQYIPAGAIPMTSYYPMYPSQQQHHPHQPILDPQYPYYFLPSRPNQAYTMPPMQQQQQTSYNDYSPTNRPQTPPPTAMAAPPQTAYNQPVNPPSSKPEMAAAAAGAAGVGLYRTAAGAAPPHLVQHHHHQQQQPQYVGFAHIHHPSQSVAPSSAAANSNYTYEYTDPNTHAQMYYNQGLTPQMVAQYQTMTSAAAASPTVVLPDASAQLPTENLKQQVRTVQP